MNATNPRARTPRKTVAQKNAEPAPVTLTEADYALDLNRVLAVMGIEPAMVIPDSARVAFVDNKVVLEYSVRRAVPPRIMGMAMLAGVRTEEVADEDEPSDG